MFVGVLHQCIHFKGPGGGGLNDLSLVINEHFYKAPRLISAKQKKSQKITKGDAPSSEGIGLNIKLIYSQCLVR